MTLWKCANASSHSASNAVRNRGIGLGCVASHDLGEEGNVDVVERLELDHLVVDERREHAGGVVDERDAAGHAGAEVASGRAEHHDATTGHVLAAVVTDALDDRGRAGVADAEPLADDASDQGFATRRSVQRDVARDDVLLGHERRPLVGEQHQPSAREALAEVVVRVAFEPQRDAARNEGAEALACRADEVDGDRAVGQTLTAVAPGQLRSRASCRRCGSRCGWGARGAPAARLRSAPSHSAISV